MWKTGDRVLANRADEMFWYPGVIRFVDNQRFYVLFDDGEDALVGADRLLPMQLDKGDRVLARQGPARSYVPGRVLDWEGDRLHIQYEAGERVWTPLAMVRIERETWKQPAVTVEPVVWNNGDRVLACCPDLFWYPGVILATQDDKIQILFDDGVQGTVGPDRVRPLQYEAGDHVYCRWQGGPEYFPGTITRKEGEIIHIRYEDGDEETTSFRLARLQRDEWLPGGEVVNVSEGDRVLACWADLLWYPGVVLSIEGKRIHMLFDDGDQLYVTPNKVVPLKLKVGDRVLCRWKAGPAYFPAEITKQQGERIYVQYDDGREEWSHMRLVRVER